MSLEVGIRMVLKVYEAGIIIPALDAGAFTGRLVGQWVTTISPGIFAMVGAAAFLAGMYFLEGFIAESLHKNERLQQQRGRSGLCLSHAPKSISADFEILAGVSRMTISLAVIMLELTGELEYVVPNMIAILVAKWVADSLEHEGVYDLAQTVLGHPFLDLDNALGLVQAQSENTTVERLIPPKQTMGEITVIVPKDNMVPRRVLEQKLDRLKERGLLDGGLVLVQDGMLQGYLAEAELDFGLTNLSGVWNSPERVRLLGLGEEGEFDLSSFVDRTPLTICAQAPMEYAVEMFGKLGLRHLCVVEEGTGKLVGVILKKRLINWLESLKQR